MSYSSVEAHAKEYFWSLSPLAKRVASDVAAARDAYEDLWITLSLSDQRQVVDDAIIRPDAALKYSFCPRGRAPVEYFPRLRLQTGGRVVTEDDGKVSWRDEHSAPFSFMTRSQLNLSLSSTEPAPRGSPHKPAEAGFLDPPSVVLGGSNTHDSPPPAGFLTRLKNKSAVLKIQALARPADRQPLLSPNTDQPSKPVEIKPASTKPVVPKLVEIKPASTKPVVPKPVENKPASTKPVVPKPVEIKAASAKPAAPKPVALKAVEIKAASANPVAPKLVEIKPASTKLVASKPVDITAKSVKSVAPKPVECKLASGKPTVDSVDNKASDSRGVSPKRKPRTPPPPPPGTRDPERVRLLPPSPDEPPPPPPAELEGARLAALQANLSLESLQEFHSALNSPTGSCSSLPKTGFDFLDNW